MTGRRLVGRKLMGNLNGNLATHLQAIETDGFTIIKNAINSAVVEEIRNELAPFCQGQKPGRNNFEGHHTERVYALLAKAPAVAKIVEHPLVLALVDELLPENYLLSAALSILVHPGETPQPFHYDDAAELLGVDKPRPRFGVSTFGHLMISLGPTAQPRSSPAATSGLRSGLRKRVRLSKCSCLQALC